MHRLRVGAPGIHDRRSEKEVAGREGRIAVGARLRPLHSGGVLAGPALIVKTHLGDNLMVHKALQIAEPGDVIVVDAGGDLTNAIIGKLILTHAEKIGLAGIVINGAEHDYGAIRANRFPLFAAGVTHRGPYKDGLSEINVPIAIDGIVVEPGDLILGDDDGLLCVPFGDTATIHADAKAKQEAADMLYARARATQAHLTNSRR